MINEQKFEGLNATPKPKNLWSSILSYKKHLDENITMHKPYPGSQKGVNSAVFDEISLKTADRVMIMKITKLEARIGIRFEHRKWLVDVVDNEVASSDEKGAKYNALLKIDPSKRTKMVKKSKSNKPEVKKQTSNPGLSQGDCDTMLDNASKQSMHPGISFNEHQMEKGQLSVPNETDEKVPRMYLRRLLDQELIMMSDR